MSKKRLGTLVIFFIIFGGIFSLHTLLFGEYGLRNPFPFESSSAYLHTGFKTCFTSTEFRKNVWRSDCYQKLADRALEAFGIEKTLKGLSVVQNDPEIRLYCHAFGHVLGQREFERTKSLADSFSSCSSTIACGEGCFHGAVERYLQAYGGSITAQSVQDACTSEETKNEVTRLSCIHGLGHAAMLERGGNVYTALPICDYLATSTDRAECYAGVFMEDAFSFSEENSPSLIRLEEPTFPCEEVENRYKAQCYSSRSTFLLQSFRNDFSRASMFCESLPAEYRTICYGTFGAEAVLISDDPIFVVSVCNAMMRVGDRMQCLRNVIKFTGHETGGEASGWKDICANTRPEDMPACLSYAGAEAERWHPKSRKELCNQIAPQVKENALCVSDI